VQKQLAQSVRASQYGMTFSGMFTVTVTLRSDADLATVEQLVEGEVARIGQEDVTERERARAVTTEEAGTVYRLEDLLARGERLQAYNHYLGDPDKLSWDLDRYRQATAKGMRDTAAKYLTREHTVELVTLPAGGGQ
jgi:predicted Zn-dependent peptidase